MAAIFYKDEGFSIVGALFVVYNNLASGFSEIVYKHTLEYVSTPLTIPFQRKKEFRVAYKGVFLKHKFYADFLLV